MCCTRIAENTRRKKSPKIRNLDTIAQLSVLLNGNISSTCPYNMVIFGSRAAEIVSLVSAPQQISTGFASCLRCCSDVAHRRPTKLCTMFGCLLCWYIFAGSCPLTEFCQVQYSCMSKSCVLLHWQHITGTALQQRASAKLWRGT